MIKKQQVVMATLIGIFSMMSGCQTTNEKVSNNVASELNKRAVALDLREAELNEKAQMLNAQQADFLEGGVNWHSILCESNGSTDRIIAVQEALKAEGFNPGRIDGFIGKSTMRAVNQFQEAKGLPVDNYINIETLKALGISAVSAQ